MQIIVYHFKARKIICGMGISCLIDMISFQNNNLAEKILQKSGRKNRFFDILEISGRRFLSVRENVDECCPGDE